MMTNKGSTEKTVRDIRRATRAIIRPKRQSVLASSHEEPDTAEQLLSAQGATGTSAAL